MKPLLVAFLVAMLGLSALAQDAAPTLTEVQRLQLVTLVQAIEIAQYRLDAAKQRLKDAAAPLEKPGYDIDLRTMTYVTAKQE